jgi:hypothetical protein
MTVALAGRCVTHRQAGDCCRSSLPHVAPLPQDNILAGERRAPMRSRLRTGQAQYGEGLSDTCCNKSAGSSPGPDGRGARVGACDARLYVGLGTRTRDQRDFGTRPPLTRPAGAASSRECTGPCDAPLPTGDGFSRAELVPLGGTSALPATAALWVTGKKNEIEVLGRDRCTSIRTDRQCIRRLNAQAHREGADGRCQPFPSHT